MHFLYKLLMVSLFSNYAMAQTKNTVLDYRDSLSSMGVDSLIVYSQECAGSVGHFITDSCFDRESNYLMWQSKGKYYIKRFDQCQKYKVIEVDSLKPFQFYFGNKAIIDGEVVKPPTFTQYFKKGNKLIKHENTVVVDHDCIYNLLFSLDGRTIEKKVSWFNLTNRDFDGKINVNYDQNQKTRLKKLIDAFDETISHIRENKMIVVE